MGKNRRLSPANTKQCRAPGTSDRTSGRVADTMTGGRGRGCRAEEKFSLLLSSAGKIDSSESCDGDAREQVEGRPPLSPLSLPLPFAFSFLLHPFSLIFPFPFPLLPSPSSLPLPSVLSPSPFLPFSFRFPFPSSLFPLVFPSFLPSLFSLSLPLPFSLRVCKLPLFIFGFPFLFCFISVFIFYHPYLPFPLFAVFPLISMFFLF